MKETIVRTFRITEETAEKLKSICANFGNQNVALESLISAYEVQNAVDTLTDRQTDIADYNSHIQALQAAFLHSLEITENTEIRIKAEFQKQLESKDSTIISLQESLKQAEITIQAADERATAAEMNAHTETEQQAAIIADLQIQLESADLKAQEQAEIIRTDKGIISDKERIISSLQAELDTAKKAADSVPELTTRAAAAEDSLVAAQREIKSLNQKLADEKKVAEQAASLAVERAEIALQKAVLAEQQKAAESARATTEEIKALYAEIVKLKDENRVLSEKQTRQSSKKKSQPGDAVNGQQIFPD